MRVHLSVAASTSNGMLLLLLLLLSRFSCVRLCATPQTAAHQAPLSLRFSISFSIFHSPFPSPVRACMPAKLPQSCPTLCDPMDNSPPGSSRQEYWSGLPFPSPSNGIKLRIFASYIISLYHITNRKTSLPF